MRTIQTIVALALILSFVAPYSALADLGDAWYNASWGYRVPITIQNAQVDADLTDFPVYVNLNNLPSSFWTNVQADCDDIRVTTTDGVTEVPVEIVSCANPNGEIHFKAPTVAGAADTEFYIYYGNGAASRAARGDTYGLENVWNSNYRAVYHLEEDGNSSAGGYLDSTPNDRHSTGVSMTAASDVTGKLGTGQDFDGANDYIAMVAGTLTLSTAASPLSVQAWINSASADQDSPIISGRNSTSDAAIFSMHLGMDGLDNAGTGFLTLIVRDGAGAGGGLADVDDNTDISDDTWHMVHATRSSAKALSLYLDGVFQATATDTMAAASTMNLDSIGAERRWIQDAFNLAPQRYFDGIIDEVRVYNTDLSASWIDAEYVNHNTPTTFYSVGTEESPIPPTILSPRFLLNFGQMLLQGGQLLIR